MSNTFEFINYHTMKALYEKCEKIINDIDNMIPVENSIEDFITTDSRFTRYPYYDDFTEKYLHELNGVRVLECTILLSINKIRANDEVKYENGKVTVLKNSYSSNWEKLYNESLSLEEYIEKCTSKSTYLITSKYLHNKWLSDPKFSFHKTCYTNAKKLVKTLSSDSDVNTLNIQLAASLTFLEELEDDSWLEGLKSFDKEEVKELLKIKTESKKEEVKGQGKKDYQEAVEEYKKKIIPREVVRKPSPEYTYKDETKEPLDNSFTIVSCVVIVVGLLLWMFY